MSLRIRTRHMLVCRMRRSYIPYTWLTFHLICSVTREPAQPEVSASDDNKTASQSSVQQSISQEWPNREMCQLVGDVCSSDPASITAEAEQDLLGRHGLLSLRA